MRKETRVVVGAQLPAMRQRAGRLLNKLCIVGDKRANLIKRHGGISSLTEIEDGQELVRLIGYLVQKESSLKRMRGKVIYFLCEWGMTTHENKPDYERINAFIKTIGSSNPAKRKLYDLNKNELLAVLNQVEKMVSK